MSSLKERKLINTWYQSAIKLLKKIIESKFIVNIIDTFVTRVLLIGVGLIASVIVARTLGPEGRGLFAVAAAVGSTGVQFGNLGLHSSNTYYISQDKKLLSSLLGNSLVTGLVFGSLGAFGAWIFFILWPGLAPVNGVLLILALAYIPVGLTYLLLQNLLIGIGEIRNYNKIELITKILYPLLILILLFVSKITPESAYCMSLISILAGFIWAMLIINKGLGNRPKPSIEVLRVSINYGIKAYIVSLLSFLVLKVDLFMVKYMLGAEQAGYYSIAVTLADMVYMLPVVIGTVLFPKLSGMSLISEKLRYTKKTILIFLPCIIIIVLLSAVLAKPVISILFGKDFLPAVAAFQLLLPGILTLSINTMFMNFFASVGMPNISIYSAGSATVINIVLNLFLVPHFGVLGASISSVAAYTVMLIISVLYVYLNKNYRYNLE